MHFNYCPNCGNKLIKKHAGDDGDVPYCERCEQYWFDGFYSVAIVLIYNEFNEIALCKQNYISKEYATITSGYITLGESAEECAVREAKEELGLDIENLEFTGTYYFKEKELLMIGFIGFSPKSEFKLSEEVDDAWWVADKEVYKYIFPEKEGNAAWGNYRYYLKKNNIKLNHE